MLHKVEYNIKNISSGISFLLSTYLFALLLSFASEIAEASSNPFGRIYFKMSQEITKVNTVLDIRFNGVSLR